MKKFYLGVKGLQLHFVVSALDSGLGGLCSRPGQVRQLCCVLWQNTTLSQYLSPSRSINGCWKIVREAWWNTGELLCDGLASPPQGSSNNPSRFILLGNWDKPQLNGLIGSCTDLTFYIHISLFQHNYHNILTLNSLNCSKSPKSEKGKEVLPCVF